MACCLPPPLTDDQLSMLIDGVADPELEAHVARCAFCATRLEQARAVERFVHATLQGGCPSPQQLGEYHLRLLAADEERRVRTHLEQCAACRAELEELQLFLVAEPGRSSPIAVSSTLEQRLRRAAGELLARLVPRAPVLALRGADAGPLLAEAEDGTTIVLDPHAHEGEHLTLNGQIIAAGRATWRGALVEARHAGMLIAATSVDDLGCFCLARVPQGTIGLRISAPDGRAIVLPAIDLPPADA